MSTGAVVARILTQYSDKGSKQAQKDIQKLGKRIDAFGAKAAKSFGLVAAATAALAVKIGKDAVNAAIEDQRAQTLLANTLAKTTGATTVQIAAVEKHIDSLEMLSTVSDTELRQSFADIVAVTGNVTSAMQVQTVALDVAKGRTLDLSTVSNAFSKAIAGNFSALKKVLPGIDANIIKNKDMAKAMAYATSVYGGSAEAFGDTEPLKRLRIAYGRVLETLGGALLPVVKEFTTYLIDRVLPGINKWVEANRTQLADSLRNAAKLAAEFLKVAVKVGQWATNNIGAVKAIAAAIATVFVVNKLSTFITSITSMIAILSKLKTQADKTNAATSKIGLVGKVGLGAVAASVGIPIAQELYNAAVKEADNIKSLKELEKQKLASEIRQDPINLAIINNRIKKLKEEIALVKKLKEEQAKFVGKGTIPYSIGMYTPQEYKVAKAELDKIAAIEAAAAAASLRATEKGLAADKKREAVLLRLRKLTGIKGKVGGITPINTREAAEQEAINFRAAELLLLKQKDNQAEIDKLKALKENVLLQGIRNTLSERYKDILVALADAKIDSKDIATLAGIWGVTTEAAKAYIDSVFAIEDGTISDDEITNLAKAWGSTKAQAGQYLDFFAALNDGILSDAEIEKLKAKWGLTEQQVRQYADFVGVVNDGKLTDSEIQKLMDKWKMTTDQVVAYLYELGAPVTYNGNLIEPGRLAELAWKNATAALEEYLRKLAQGTGGPTGGPSYDPKASADANKEAADAWAAANDAAAEAAKGNSDATNAALAAAEAVMKMAAEIEATTLKLQSGKKFLTDAQMDQVLTTAGSPYAPSATVAGFDDERAKFQAKYGISSTIANASTIGTSSSSTPVVVNLVVNGSVSTEQDLVQSVRNGLLAAQTNGQGLTLQAI